MNLVTAVQDLLQSLPVYIRRGIYAVFLLALVIHGCVALWFDDPDPEQVRKVGDILQYLGVGVGLLALGNARPMPGEEE